MSESISTSDDEAWTDEKNERRAALIIKDGEEGLTTPEGRELVDLTTQLRDQVSSVGPLSVDSAQALKRLIESDPSV